MDTRYEDPTIAQINYYWRDRQNMVRADTKLVLQIKAMCRSLRDGDKKEGDKFYKELNTGQSTLLEYSQFNALFEARKPILQERKRLEKQLANYDKELDGIYKRAGLAVVEGERQRKHSNKDMAILHGYNPSRHAVFWTIGDSLLKAQGKEEKAGPYRKVYDTRKLMERERVETDGHAHNRALRYMTKRLIKDLYIEWKGVSDDQGVLETIN